MNLPPPGEGGRTDARDRKSTRLNSSHVSISYAVFCLPSHHRVFLSFPTRRSSDLYESFVPRCVLAVFWLLEECSSSDPHPAYRTCVRSATFSRREKALTLKNEPSPSGRRWPNGRKRSEEHTSELQSRFDLVCRLLLALPPPSLSLFPYTTLFRSVRVIRPALRPGSVLVVGRV